MSFVYFSSFIISLVFSILVSRQQIYVEKQNIYSKKRAGIHLNKDTIFALIIIVCFSLLCATRKTDNYDMQPYMDYLRLVNRLPLFEIDGTYGIGFEITTKIWVLIVSVDYKAYFGLIAFINCLIVWDSLKNINGIRLYGLAIYLGFLGFFYNFIVLRQAFAISFTIQAYARLITKKNTWVLSLLCAMLFHESALLAFIIFVIGRKIRLRKITLYLCLFISLALYLTKLLDVIIQPLLGTLYNILPSNLFHKYILYFDNVQYIHDISLMYLLYYAISFFIIYSLSLQRHIFNNAATQFLIVCNLSGLFLLATFSSLSAIIRAADYLSTTTYVFLMPMALKKSGENSRTIIILILFALAIILYLRIILGKTSMY